MAHRSDCIPRIIIDTREQLPYAFDGYDVLRNGLKTGDYSIEGHEDRVCVERKSKADAWGVVGGGRKRFVRELERMREYERAAIVIECTLAEFARPPLVIKRSGAVVQPAVSVAQAVGSYVSWAVKYRVQVFWCPDDALPGREYGERITLRFLAAYLKHCAR